jgi:5-methylcytosine-specific restriction endonuclease McrA
MNFTRTLILNQGYLPHEVVGWREAVTRMFNGKLDVIAQYDEVLTVIGRNHLSTFPELARALRQVIGTDAQSITIKVPAVAVLRRKVRMVKTGVKFSKVNVCLRDGFRCQYCNIKLPMSQLEYEHVIPKSQWKKATSPTTWTNIVMACTACNSRKADRTPEEAGMPLLSVPVKPKTLPMHGPYLDGDDVPSEWVPFVAVA